MKLHVSPLGNDSWSGRYPDPAPDGDDGPLKTIGKAQRLLSDAGRPHHKDPEFARSAAQGNSPATMVLREGRYLLEEPLTFRATDRRPLTIAAAEGETARISGGCRLTGWKETAHQGHRSWELDLPEVRAGLWSFDQLWVNDRRAERPRFPETGTCRIEDAFLNGQSWGGRGSDRFIAKAGDFQPFHNLGDVEVVVLHFWIEERMPVESYDPESRLVVSRYISHAPLSWSFGTTPAPYYIDNVYEAFRKPGQWYLDRPAGRLMYLPREGEQLDSAEIFAPVLEQLVVIEGDPEKGHYVENLNFEGITFEHTTSPRPQIVDVPGGGPQHEPLPPRDKPRAAAPQAAYHVPGALVASGVRQSGFRHCVFKHLGGYGLDFGCGCSHIEFVHNEITDTGAGGVKIGGGKVEDPLWQRTGFFRITDNHVHAGGQIHHCGTGIQLRHAGDCLVAHNHIHDYYYSAISVGWTWGYHPTVSHNNLIEFNHIHDIGKGLLSDMGGIYLLGVAPGTVVRNNLIHGVRSAHYGGWGIYPDEGSSHLLIENNLCYDTQCPPFHQHFGRENIVRNNIFAFGCEAVFAFSRSEACRGLSVYHNIFLGKGVPMFTSGYANNFGRDRHAFGSDLNLFWDLEGVPVLCREKAHTTAALDNESVDFATWQSYGFDLHSVIADPGFADPESGDFTLPEDSPAFDIGFKALDVSKVGIRPAQPEPSEPTKS
ncbi:MAG: right-handed parallel beta-helix repeat-containing protein [Verrucomicrobia bacterium]|nr:right-handed parallel beta-helix repeat-containing protein [Verrucomicrobiota bacterium]MCH8525551.1 right-handed parallel beta-helix repeat-containing protein [Kiritimatiellia bacterium]